MGLYHYAMVRLHVTGGEDGLQKWRVEADILRKQYQIADSVSGNEPSAFRRVY